MEKNTVVRTLDNETESVVSCVSIVFWNPEFRHNSCLLYTSDAADE